MMKYYIVPNNNELDKYLKFANENNLGFEYDDFYIPSLLDNKNKLQDRINLYKNLGRVGDTLHGVFLDIVLDSQDPKIKQISYDRVHTSMEIAKKLNCKGVVFHTNYINWMKKDIKYKKRWIEENAKIYLSLINEFDDIEIYIENMFDDSPDMLYELIKYINHERIGVCLDIAHASISKVDIKIWFDKLSKYIKHLHINDNDLEVDNHLEIGKGKIDYKKIYEYIKSLNDNVSVLIEISDYEATVNSYKYLKDVVLYAKERRI